MDPNIPNQPTQNEIPVMQPNLQKPINEIPRSASKWKLILLIIILLILGGLGAYYLQAKQIKLTTQKQITPIITQSSPMPSLTPFPTMEPGKSIDTTNWTVFKDSATSLSVKYPPAWKITEGQKSANTPTYSYNYLNLSGKEGDIALYKQNQLGGGCDNYHNISINGSTTYICQLKPSGTREDELWNQLYVRPLTHVDDPNSNPKNFAFQITATIHQPIAQNRDVILQILNTITGVKIPANQD